MRRTERIIYVDIREAGEGRGKVGLVLLLFRVKAKILEEYDAIPGANGLVYGRFRPFTDAVLGKGHRPPENLRKPRGYRSKAELPCYGPLRPPEMAGEHSHRRTTIQRVLDRRNRGADASVVADASLLERDVEVDADEDALALQIEVFDRQLSQMRKSSL
jgi:hypothetical protein